MKKIVVILLAALLLVGLVGCTASTETDGMSWWYTSPANPANPASPLSPANPINPASPLHFH